MNTIRRYRDMGGTALQHSVRRKFPYQGPLAPPAGGLFPSFTNIWAHYDTEAETPVADDTPMSQWTDWSGNGRHMTQSGVSRPRYRTSQINGRPAIRTDKSDFSVDPKWFVLPDMSALTAGHWFVVLKMLQDTSSTGGENNGPWNITTDSSNDVYFAYNGDNQIHDSWGSTARKSFSKLGIALNQWNLYEVQSAAGLWKAYLNGTLLHGPVANTVGFNSSPLFGQTLFSRTATLWATEAVICSSIQSEPLRADMATYANAEYGLSVI